ncbi:hypothetical protein BH09PSE3_BH09PSE3_17250 [soil metagenome]
MRNLALLLALLPAPALASQRSLTVTEFNRIRIEGTFNIEIVTGHGPSARVTGSEQAVERTDIKNQGQMLIVRSSASSWGGMPGDNPGVATIRLTTSELRTVGSSGASTVKINHMQGQSVSVGQDGSGAVNVGSVTADTLDLAMAGAGSLTVAGKAAQVHVAVRGAGTFDASALATTDLRLTLEGSATVKVAAGRSANIVANGTGSVVVAGTPACTVVNRGSGSVACGKAR